ncbi:MAG: hypothetical protein M3394_10440, partial [Actinomycetota bacterium]|nr:hypothetical protein [Actinomycetota bacterium]
AAPSGELAVSPAGAFVDAAGLKPGGTAHGRVTVRNQTGSSLSLVGRTTSSSPESGELRMRMAAGGTVVSDGPPEQSATGSLPFVVASGEEVVFAVDVSLLPDSSRLLGQDVDIALQFDVEKANT